VKDVLPHEFSSCCCVFKVIIWLAQMQVERASRNKPQANEGLKNAEAIAEASFTEK